MPAIAGYNKVSRGFNKWKQFCVALRPETKINHSGNGWLWECLVSAQSQLFSLLLPHILLTSISIELV